MLSEALQQRTTKASLFICPVAGADTIACLTGYPQDMCVAIATHGPQACTLSLCSVPAASRWCSLKDAQQYKCSMIHTNVLNTTQKLLNGHLRFARPVTCSICHGLARLCVPDSSTVSHGYRLCTNIVPLSHQTALMLIPRLNHLSL